MVCYIYNLLLRKIKFVYWNELKIKAVLLDYCWRDNSKIYCTYSPEATRACYTISMVYSEYLSQLTSYNVNFKNVIDNISSHTASQKYKIC